MSSFMSFAQKENSYLFSVEQYAIKNAYTGIL